MTSEKPGHFCANRVAVVDSTFECWWTDCVPEFTNESRLSYADRHISWASFDALHEVFHLDSCLYSSAVQVSIRHRRSKSVSLRGTSTSNLVPLPIFFKWCKMADAKLLNDFTCCQVLGQLHHRHTNVYCQCVNIGHFSADLTNQIGHAGTSWTDRRLCGDQMCLPKCLGDMTLRLASV